VSDAALLAALLGAAFFFAFLNGFHDSANLVATIIASRAITPRRALLLASCGQFLGPLVFGVAVAATVGSGLVDPGAVTVTVVLAALLAASWWDLVTWWRGLPTSSSHALAGGLIGAAVAFGGWGQLLGGGLARIGLALLLSPVIGFGLAWVVYRLVMLAAGRSGPGVNRVFNRLQWVSAAALSLAHGANDAQKTAGIIGLGLVTLGFQPRFSVPLWAVAACALSISLGTSTGGWRIIRTLGGRFYRIRPVHSLSAQVASAAVVVTASLLGGPVSTTHVASSAVIGAGASDRLSKVRWEELRGVVVAWVVTVPVSIAAGAAFYYILRLVIGP
jgi:PiT family inorganic phosphate transporter